MATAFRRSSIFVAGMLIRGGRGTVGRSVRGETLP